MNLSLVISAAGRGTTYDRCQLKEESMRKRRPGRRKDKQLQLAKSEEEECTHGAADADDDDEGGDSIFHNWEREIDNDMGVWLASFPLVEVLTVDGVQKVTRLFKLWYLMDIGKNDLPAKKGWDSWEKQKSEIRDSAPALTVYLQLPVNAMYPIVAGAKKLFS